MVAVALKVPTTWISRALVALAGGVVGALSLPPWGWWPLGIAGLTLYAIALHGQPARRRAVCGAAFSLGLFGIGLFWITEFHAVGFVVLLLLEGSFFVAGAMATARLTAFPATIVLAESARGAVPFGGLPLGGLALGQAQGPFVASARIGGGLLVLGLVATLAAAFALVIVGDKGWRRSAPALAAFALAFTALGWVAPAGRDRGEPIDAVLVQGGGRRGFRAIESDSGDVLAAHLEQSKAIASGEYDLVLWPENAIDVTTLAGSAAERALGDLARRADATVIAGVTQDAGADGFDNTAVVWRPDGRVADRYTKVRRVPFGEYVPMRGFLEDLVDLSALPRDAVAGDGSGVVRTPAGDFAVSISYEVFFADRALSGVRDGGEVLLVPTNAASFTTSQVPTQEVAAAQLRAWETGRWVLQAAPTGYSAVIDHRGRVLDRSVLGRGERLEAAVSRRTGDTLYLRFGDAPVLLLALVVLTVHQIIEVRGSRR